MERPMLVEASRPAVAPLGACSLGQSIFTMDDAVRNSSSTCSCWLDGVLIVASLLLDSPSNTPPALFVLLWETTAALLVAASDSPPGVVEPACWATVCCVWLLLLPLLPGWTAC